MTESLDTAQETFSRLRQAVVNQHGRDKLNEQYLEGTQAIEQLGLAIPPEFMPFGFPLNWCRTYVNILLERMDVRMILRRGEDVEDSELRADWEANNMNLQCQDALRDLLVYGRMVLTVSADPDGKRPRIRVENPKNFAVLTDFITGETQAALRVYRHDETNEEAATLYLPNETIFYESLHGQKVPTERIVHNLGRVPVVQASIRDWTGHNRGKSVMEDLKRLVNMAARVMLNLQVAMETVATPQKIATGVTQEDFLNEDGTKKTVWESYIGAILALSSKDAKVQQLPASDMKGFLDTIEMLTQQAASVSGLPMRMLGQASVNPPAEGAIRAEEARLIKQAERISQVAGYAFGWTLGIAERIRTHTWDDSGGINIVWHDPATPTVAQRADALAKLRGAGVLSRRGLMTELGWAPQRIEQEMRWLDEEEGGASIDRLFRSPIDVPQEGADE